MKKFSTKGAWRHTPKGVWLFGVSKSYIKVGGK